MTISTLPATLLILCCLVISLFATGNVGKINDLYRKNITCIGQERDALLKFKHHIQADHCGLMSSWGNPNTPDCCTWKGVTCSNQTGYVIELHLNGAPYYPKWQRCLVSPIFSPSLSELKHLKYLDISSNYFNDKAIPSSIGSIVSLIHLDLSNAGFSGNIPRQLGNLTRLTYLDLSNNNGLSAKSLNWLSRLISLRRINLHGTDLSKAKDWSQIIGSLPLLEALKMGDCELSTPTSSSFLKYANLRVIILYGNYFSSYSSFRWLLNTSNNSSVKNQLKYLDLSRNLLQGPIPDAIRNLESLTYLNLSGNSLSSTIPDAIGNLQLLTYLDLSRNSLSNTIPEAIGNLKSLAYLNLHNNSLSSIIPDSIANLHSLTHMDLSYNSLSGPIPFSLGPFGALRTLHSLSYLNLSYNRLEGSIPSTIGNSYSILKIDLSNNHLQGPIPSSLGGASSLSHLDFSNNHLEGVIPTSIANLEYLGYLDLSRNNLTGDIPCKLEIKKVPYFANFSYNNLSGSIPKYLSYLGPKAFQGNPSFRMKEVQNDCGEDTNLPNEEQVGGDNNDKIDPVLYVSIGLGFYTGFWAFCGTLTVKNSWRHSYFRFLDRIIDKIYATVAVFIARFQRKSHM